MSASKTVGVLEAGAETIKSRNALYGDTHEQVAIVLCALFPRGVRFPSTYSGMNRLFLVMQCANKITRYAALLESGGHKDSAHDLMIYAAMLEGETNG